MKTPTILIISLCVFLALSIFGGISRCNLIKLTKEKTELETKFILLDKEKTDLQLKLAEKQVQNSILDGQKKAIESQLAQYRADTQKQIEAFKKTITGLSSIPSDTIYLDLFSMWPVYDGILKYRFAENQIRGMWLNVLERNQFESLYSKTDKSLIKCTELNVQNDKIIVNLKDQNENLKGQVDISDLQLGNLQDNLKLTERELKRKKFWNFILKGSTVAGGAGWIAFVLK
jgi:hypothetical protein